MGEKKTNSMMVYLKQRISVIILNIYRLKSLKGNIVRLVRQKTNLPLYFL